MDFSIEEPVAVVEEPVAIEAQISSQAAEPTPALDPTTICDENIHDEEKPLNQWLRFKVWFNRRNGWFR